MTTGRILTHIAPRTSLRLAAACVAAVCAWALPAASAFAEGSVDFNTGADTRYRNYLEQYGTGGNYTVLRVYARAGETIQMASSVMGLAGGQDDIRVYAPGTSFASSTNASAQAPFPTDPVFSTAVFDCNVGAPGTGRIASRTEELAGPAPNPGGYVACEFTAPSDGIYPVVMIPYDPVTSTFGTGRVGTPGTTTAQGHAISMWDVTVRAAGGAVQPGRVFANRLTLAEGGGLTPTNAPNPVAYLYTPAGYQYRVSFFAHNGVTWFMAADGKGVVDATSGQRLFASFDTSGGGQAIAPLVSVGPTSRSTPATRSSSASPTRSRSAGRAGWRRRAATRRPRSRRPAR